MAGKSLGRQAGTLSVPGEPEAPADWPVRLRLTVLGRSLRESRLVELEEAVQQLTFERWQQLFTSDTGIRETGLLRTCHRIEVYLVSQGEGVEERAIATWGLRAAAWERRSGFDAALHLFRVAAGLESRAPGEREVGEQIQIAASRILSRHPRPLLRRMFVAATRSSGTVQPEAVAPSLADLATDRVFALGGDAKPRVLVIGAGTMGKRVVERLAGRAQVSVMYRTRPPAEPYLKRYRASAVSSVGLREELRHVDAVVVAAKSGGHVLAREDFPIQPSEGPTLIVDLGVPRNVDPAIGQLPGRLLLNIEELPAGPAAPGVLASLERAARERAEQAYADFERENLELDIAVLRRAAEVIRQEELARAESHAGPVPERARVAFRRMSERLARRLMEAPTDRLRALSLGAEETAVLRRLLVLLGAPAATL